MTDPAALDELERSLAMVVRLLADRATASDVAERCGYNLPPASWALLEHLDDRGSLRVSDIALCHGVEIPSITPRLKRLESEGLLRRDREPSDARAYLISITSDGAHALEAIHATRRDILREALVGVDASQVVGAVATLGRIADHLTPEQLSVVGR